MIAFLERAKQKQYALAMWLGVAAGVVFSIVLAGLVQMYATSLSAEALEIYEGVMMISAALLLLWMIGWMALYGKKMKMHIEQTMAMHIAGGSALGIFLLSFTSTAREGAELVLLIHASLLGSASSMQALTGVGIGIVGALALAVLLLRGIRIIPLHYFFTATGIFLLLLGTGLTMDGIHELEEAGIITELAYELTPSVFQLLSGLAYAALATLTWRRVTV